MYALVNKPYILDLIPGRSFIIYLVQQGVDVYLLDWGIPGPEDTQRRPIMLDRRVGYRVRPS